jgi:hypothetical protein
MTVCPDPIRVLETDRFQHGVLIRFADGTIIFYGGNFSMSIEALTATGK